MTPTPESQLAAEKLDPMTAAVRVQDLLDRLPPFDLSWSPIIRDAWCKCAGQLMRWIEAAPQPRTPAPVDHAALAEVKKRPKLGRSDWVDCPICGESDMRKQIDPDSDDGEGYIYCVNTNCGSNGGDNFAALRAHPAGGVSGAVSNETVARDILRRAGYNPDTTLIDMIAKAIGAAPAGAVSENAVEYFRAEHARYVVICHRHNETEERYGVHRSGRIGQTLWNDEADFTGTKDECEKWIIRAALRAAGIGAGVGLQPSSSYHSSLSEKECHADRDGDCNWEGCPQLRNRQSHCPLDTQTDED